MTEVFFKKMWKLNFAGKYIMIPFKDAGIAFMILWLYYYQGMKNIKIKNINLSGTTSVRKVLHPTFRTSLND